MRGRPGTPTYAEWLRLPELLALQNGPKAAWHEPEQPPAALMEPEGVSPDENLFIVVHQCFEIWFKVMLNHLDRTAAALTAGDVPLATRLVRRLVLLQQWLVQQIRMPATMLPLDFMRFRSQQKEEDGRVLVTGLSPASGTESYQFREVEILCGLRDDSAFRGYLAGASAECGVRSAKCPAATADHQPPTADCRPPTAGCTASTGALPVRLLTPRQAERLREPTLMEAFQQVVRERGLHRLDDLFTPADVPNPHADLAGLADLLLDFDEFFRQWRLAHVSMVEKMIGARSGTGYLGPEYLQETAGLGIQKENRVLADHQVRPHFFEELWAVRSRLGQ